MGEGLPAHSVLLGRVVGAPELQFGGEEALHAHGAPGVDPARGDVHLGIQAQTVSVSKPGKN